jgi:Methane oxygenase PmoA
LIDGVNAWEGPAYAPYQTRIVPVSIDPSGAGFVATYRWENEGVPLLRGQTICQSRLAGDDMYSLVLDYQFETPGDRPVLLDRNPPPTAGYSGLSIRVVREFRHAKYLDADGRTAPPPRGTPTAWQSYSGPIDGGPQRKGGVALLDNPTNLRFPAPTYCIHESTDFGFLQCAILYQESYLLQPSDPLRLRYQVILFDGEASAAKIQSRFDEFAQEAGV